MQTKSQLRKPHEIIVDSEGIWCPPTPMIDLFKAWRQARLGDLIELRATEPMIQKDVRNWAQKSGNELVEVSREEGYTRVVVRITKRGKETMELSASKTNVDNPDQTKITTKAKLQIVTVGGFTMGLRTLEPGWRWTTCMKPIASTETCQIRHIGYVVSGRMGFLMDDGTKLEVGPGDAFEVRPGHDTWTIGEAPAVFLDLIGATQLEKPSQS
jgi:TusA-related sulfurtransferase